MLALVNDGLKKGDVIMIQLLNCPEFVFTYIAAHKTHTVSCLVNYRLSSGLEDSWL
jgi:acyl-CoA synthetase (AMP-forming)/AMP-acid ligase II